jgi:hypothetical protein
MIEELGVPDLDLIKQAQQGVGWERGPFCSGSLAGRSKICYDHVASPSTSISMPMCSRSSVPS